MAKGDRTAVDKEAAVGTADRRCGHPRATSKPRSRAAAQESRKRIAALAAVQSYGGSQYGLTNRANTIFNAAGQDIRLASDMRQGNLAAYNVAKAVEPIKIVQHGGG